MRLYRPLLFVLFLAGALISTGAAERDYREVRVDNESIQTYRNHLGRWLIPGRESLSSLAGRFGVTTREILDINDGSYNPTGFIFVPMSQEVYRNLVEEGHGRRIYQIESGRVLWPLEDPGYTSRYGRRWDQMHTGLDFSCAINSVVVAAQDGVVEKVGWMGSYGKMVILVHENGLETRYAHNNTLLLREGEHVKQGQVISFSGNTGRSTGPHMHFEVRYLGVAMDPEDFLPYGLANPGLVRRESIPSDRPVADNETEKSALAGPSLPAKTLNP